MICLHTAGSRRIRGDFLNHKIFLTKQHIVMAVVQYCAEHNQLKESNAPIDKTLNSCKDERNPFRTARAKCKIGGQKMKVAAAYENGEVFQHFGHTKQFKVYEIEDGKVVSSEIVETNGQGHSALADFLHEQAVSTVICGGIGEGAQAALTEQGIELFAGVSGQADEAVEKYIKGELTSTGANCDHHGEDGSCGGHEDGGCGSACGGGCGGCHSKPPFEGKNVGKTMRVHYKGTFNDGTQFDSSYDRGEPLEFVCGAGMMILGFDKAVANMEVGQIADVHLEPSEAYGEADPDAIFTVEIDKMPGAEALEAGQQVYLQNMYGQPFPVKVTAKDESTITFDANHEMAGKELNFRIEIVEIL